jgi:hypothetical protein
MTDHPRWPTQWAVLAGGVIVLILAAMGEVVLLPPEKLYERLLVFAIVTGMLAARIHSIRVCAALAAFAAGEFICYLATGASAADGGRLPFVIPILFAAVIGRGYRTQRIRESASHR